MQMTEGEITRVYKSAKNKKKQISILADLNGCSTGRILGIVHSDKEKQGTEDPCSPAEWKPTREERALMHRLDELDAMIKPLEDEYRMVAEKLMGIGECMPSS